MTASIRPVVIGAALAALGLAGCAMPQSSSPGTAPRAVSTPGYVVPSGYVSGLNVIPYQGRIASKCDDFDSQKAREGCIRVGG